MNILLKKDILELYEKTPLKSIWRVLSSNKYLPLLTELISETWFLLPEAKIWERLYCYINWLSEPKKCNLCKDGYCRFDQLPQWYYKYCSVKCQRNSPEYSDLVKKVSQEKYWVDHFSASQDVKDKKEQKSMDRYGTKTPTQSQEVKDKTKVTNLERYWVENSSQNKEIKEKTKNTLIAKYWVKHTWQAKEVIEKSNKTRKERYWEEVFTKTALYREKTKITSQEKFWADHFMKSKEWKEIFMKVINDRYSKETIEKYNKLLLEKQTGIEIVSGLTDKWWIYVIKELTTGITKEVSLGHIYDRLRLGLDADLINSPVWSYDKSLIQKRISDFLTDIYEGEISTNNRQALCNWKEIDIYLPEIKMWFEINGIYRHSDNYLEKQYHYDKWSTANLLWIKLYQFYEDELDRSLYFLYNKISWTGKLKESLDIDSINTKYWTELKPFKKFNWRDITAKIIDQREAKDFLNKYHLQWADNSWTYVGIKSKNGDLLGVYSYYLIEWEKELVLNRYCVAGWITLWKWVFEKSLNEALTKIDKKKIDHLVSFADLRYADYENNVYERSWFEKDGDIRNKCDYQYVLNKDRYHKANFRKDSLISLIDEIKELEWIEIKIDTTDSETTLYEKIKFSWSAFYDIKRIYNVWLVKWKKKIV